MVGAALGAAGGVARVGILLNAVSNVAGILNRDSSAADKQTSAMGRLRGALTKLTLGWLIFGKVQALVVAGLSVIAASKAAATFQTFAEAAQRARLHLRILGLEMEDIGFQMIRVEGVLGRQLATQIFQSAEATSFLASASRDVIDEALLLSKQLAAFGDIDPAEFFIAAMEAIQNGDFDILNRMFPGANIESEEDLYNFFRGASRAVEDVDLTVWDKIKQRTREIGDILSGWAGFFLTFLQQGTLGLLNTVLKIIQAIDWVFRGIQLVFTSIWEFLTKTIFGGGFRRDLRELWRQWFDDFLGIFGPFEDIVRRWFTMWVNIINRAFVAIGDWFTGVARAATQFFKDLLTLGPLEALRLFVERVKVISKDAWDKFREPWSGIASWINTWVVGPIIGAFDRVERVVTRVWGGLLAVLESIKDAAQWLIDNLDRIRMPSGIKVPDLSIPGFASGGIVPGPPGAPQLVVAHGGETVLPTHRGGGGPGMSGATHVTLVMDERVVGEVVFNQFERNVRLKTGMTAGRDVRG